MIQIFKANAEQIIVKKTINELKKTLPKKMQGRADRYLSKEAEANFVIGRMLLKTGLEKMNLSHLFEEIQYSPNSKPSIAGVHFNISHTEGLVVCAFSEEEIGIDIEKKRSIHLPDFLSFFTKKEWEKINTANKPEECFFRLWVKKESIIKALGVSLKQLNEIDTSLELNNIFFKDKDLFLKELDLKGSYFGAICTPFPAKDIEWIEVS